jgi:hypothetical protein
MATSINNPLAVNLQTLSSAVAEVDRTYTVTRGAWLMDLLAYKDATIVAGAAATITVANGADTVITMTTANPPVVNTTYRLGDTTGAKTTVNTLDDDYYLLAAGDTMVFACDTASTFNVTAVLYPTPQ